MSEYIYGSIGDPLVNVLGEIYLPRAEVVRCRDCKYSDAFKTRYQQKTVYACLNFDSAAIEPDGFCAWGERANFATCECGEDIELGNCESAVCPRCNRTVRA